MTSWWNSCGIRHDHQVVFLPSNGNPAETQPFAAVQSSWRTRQTDQRQLRELNNLINPVSSRCCCPPIVLAHSGHIHIRISPAMDWQPNQDILFISILPHARWARPVLILIRIKQVPYIEYSRSRFVYRHQCTEISLVEFDPVLIINVSEFH